MILALDNWQFAKLKAFLALAIFSWPLHFPVERAAKMQASISTVIWIFVGKILCVVTGREVNQTSVFKSIFLNSINVFFWKAEALWFWLTSPHATLFQRRWLARRWSASCYQRGCVSQSVVFHKWGGGGNSLAADIWSSMFWPIEQGSHLQLFSVSLS